MRGGVVGGQGAVEGDGFLGGLQRLPVPAHLVQPDAEIVQRRGEAGLVRGGVVGGQSAVEGDDQVSDRDVCP